MTQQFNWAKWSREVCCWYSCKTLNDNSRLLELLINNFQIRQTIRGNWRILVQYTQPPEADTLECKSDFSAEFVLVSTWKKVNEDTTDNEFWRKINKNRADTLTLLRLLQRHKCHTNELHIQIPCVEWRGCVAYIWRKMHDHTFDNGAVQESNTAQYCSKHAGWSVSYAK